MKRRSFLALGAAAAVAPLVPTPVLNEASFLAALEAIPVPVNLNPTQVARTFFVDSALGINHSRRTGLSPKKPLATIAAAVKRAQALSGDTIMVAPGYVEVVRIGEMTVR